MAKIVNISCHKILDSRGNWTIETHVDLEDGSTGIQTIPGGASVGEREAATLTPEKAVQVISQIIEPALIGVDANEQHSVDKLLIEIDNTPNKSNLGGNTMLSVSQAIAKAAAKSQNLELWEYLSVLFSGTKKSRKAIKYPTPLFNVINGGKHAKNNLSFQEFMIIPARSLPIEKALQVGVTIYHKLEENLLKDGFEVGVGDEGGFAPDDFTADKALAYMRTAALDKYKPGEEVFFGMDVAAGSFYSAGYYLLTEENLKLTGPKLSEYFADLLKKYELIYIEDPFYEHDEKAWKAFTAKYGINLLVTGDDLVVTNPQILKSAISEKLLTAVIIKPNQIGTVSETLEFIRIAKAANLKTIVSHRSGDTAEDTFIADLGVAVDADFIKAGAPTRGERVAKYNRLLEILSGE